MNNDVIAGFLGPSSSRPEKRTVTFALAYARVSTKAQEERGLSISAQVREINQHARRNEITILKTYTEAASGFQDEERRVEFWRMFEQAKNDKRVSLILVHESSRFCRDPWRTPQLIGELQAHGVRVVSVTEPYFDLDSIPGMWMQKVNEARNASYSLEVGKHTIKGMRENIQRRDLEIPGCYKNGGAAPWGFQAYKVQRGTDKRGLPILKTLWRLDETEVAGRPVHEWARACLLLAAEGASLDKLRDFCNQRGIPAPRKQYWCISTWHTLLEPHKLLQYAGFGVWNVHDKRGGKRPHAEWDIVPDAHPALITLEQAKAIKDARESKAPMLPRESGARARTNGSRFLLSGELFRCERCGSNMVGYSSTNGKGRKGHYYVCGSAQYRRSLGCGPGIFIDKDAIESAVLDGIIERFREWSDMKAFAKRVNAKIRALHQQYASAGIEASRQIADIERKMANIRRHLENGLKDTEWANARLEQLTAEHDEWLGKQSLIEASVKPPELDLDAVKAYHERFLDVMANGTNQQRREMVRFFVETIALRPAAPPSDAAPDQKNMPAAHELVVSFKAMPAMFVKGLVAGAGFEPATFGL